MHSAISGAVFLPAFPVLYAGLFLPPILPSGFSPVAIATAVKRFFARSRESEADHIGQLLMADAGYNPLACATMYTKLNKYEERFLAERKKEDRDYKPIPGYMSTHPHVSLSVLSCVIDTEVYVKQTASRIAQYKDWAPKSLEIVGRLAPDPDQSQAQAKKIEDMKRRWADFVERRDQK